MAKARREGASGPRRGWPAALARLGWAAALTGAFGGALVAAVSIHSGTPAFRRAAITVGNAAMAGLFEGDITVAGVESLSIGARSTVRAKSVTVTTADGAPVVIAEDVEAEIALFRLLASLVSGGPPVIDVPVARMRTADVLLDADEAGVPLIAHALQPRTKPSGPRASATGVPAQSARHAQHPTITLPSILVAHARVHGDAIPPSLDGDADGVRARLAIDRGFARIELDEARVTLRSPHVPGQRVPATGTARGALAIELATTDLEGHIEIQGACGGIPIAARARIDGDEVDASVEIPRTEPGAIAGAFGDVPLETAVEITARAHGKLPTLALEARGRLGDAAISAHGELDLREGRPFELEIDVEGFDAKTLGADLATQLSGTLRAEGTFASSAGPVGRFRLRTREGAVGREPIPALFVEGRFEPEHVTATLRANDSGVALTGKVTAHLPDERASFDLQARSSSLRSWPRAQGFFGGAASARAQGEVDLRRRTIEATVEAAGERIGIDTLSARRLSATGTLEGPLAAPLLDVSFAATRVRMQAKGKEALVYPSAAGRARIAFAPSPSIVRGNLRIGGAEGKPVTASAEGVKLANGVLEARGIRVTGIGEPLVVDLQLGGPHWRVRAKSAGVDLRRAGALTGLVGLELLPEGTHATLDVDVRQEPDGASGHVDVLVRTAKDSLVSDAVLAEARASVDRGKLVGRARLSADGVGHVEIARAELDLPPRLDARSLRRTTGVLDLRGELDLSYVAALAGPPVERIAGTASFVGRIERGDAEALPAVRATVRTEGLDVAIARERSPLVVSGVDLSAHVAWDGRTDDTEVALMTWDVHGRLGTASAKAKLPLALWATGARKLDAASIANLEVDALAELPSRQVASLPSFLSVPDLRGRVEGTLRVVGPLGRPDVRLSGRARGLRATLGSTRAPSFAPLDGTLEARWDGERAAITFALDERRRVGFRAPGWSASRAPASSTDETRGSRSAPGHVRGLVVLTDLRATDLLHGRALSALPWAASAEVEVENLALGALPLPHALTGALSGRARVRDLNRDPSFEANAHVEAFGLRGTNAGELDLTVGGRDASLFAYASLADEDGKAVFQVASQSPRVSGLDVAWDHSAPTRIDYAVQNGRLALLGPIVRRTIPEIDGRVDGAGSITLDQGTQVFEGGLAVQGARMYVSALGEEISSFDAVARFDRTGTFRIEEATGKMGAGAFRASASGRMKGLEFDSGEATILVPKDAVPLSSQAVTFAEATGEVKVLATMSEDRSALLLTVDVPRANVELPDRSAQSLQSLEPDPTVAVGVRRRDGELDTSAVVRGRGGTGRSTSTPPRDVLTVRMGVTLGDRVQLQGRGLDVSLDGRTLVELADELAVTGSLDLRSGTIEVHGRRFQVEHGTVTFPEGGTPDNPTIIGAAYWDAPDRTRVWVEFAGPLKTGKLTLRSEPAYTKTEILSVLLFGRPDPNMGVADGSTSRAGDAAGATAVGTGFFAGDINRMLSEIDPNLDVETDTLSGNRARGKVGHSFFDRRVKVQVGYAAGSPYRHPLDTTFLFLNWHFVPKWSLVATAGNKGTTILDLLFQHRY